MGNYSKGAIFAGKQADKCHWKKNKCNPSCIGSGFVEKGWLNGLRKQEYYTLSF